MTRICLSLGYTVVSASSFDGLSAELYALLGVPRLFIVTNPTVRALHGASVHAELAGTFSVEWFEIPDGEAHKSLEVWATLAVEMLARRPDRDTVIVALGGGVVGDLAGFAAATVLRGLPFIQLPTTLLAMVDASVGGKTAVNAPVGKNLVGAFHQPRLVWAAMSTLETLPIEELRGGLGEVVKHAVLDSRAALDRCDELANDVLARNPVALCTVVAHSVGLKARIVEADPMERGVRALLNLGHTLGHGVEACLGYGQMRHGEAVALGLVAIARYSLACGFCRPDMLDRLTTVVRRLGLPTELPSQLSVDTLADAMRFDKKRGRGKVKLVVPYDFGDVRLCEVDERELLRLAQLARSGASE